MEHDLCYVRCCALYVWSCSPKWYIIECIRSFLTTAIRTSRRNQIKYHYLLCECHRLELEVLCCNLTIKQCRIFTIVYQIEVRFQLKQASVILKLRTHILWLENCTGCKFMILYISFHVYKCMQAHIKCICIYNLHTLTSYQVRSLSIM